MRLWHKDLIPVLPRKQLIAQWRECCAIASNIANKGTPNHLLVNKVLDYPVSHFEIYTYSVIDEIRKRYYKVNEKSIVNFSRNINEAEKYFNNENQNDCLFEGWHNERYLFQCIMNLQEKSDCGMFDGENIDPLLNFIKKTIYI